MVEDNKRDLNLFSDRLKEALSLNNMTQKELAEKTGLTVASISRYITGTRVPSASVIRDVAVALNVTTDYLLGLSTVVTKPDVCMSELETFCKEQLDFWEKKNVRMKKYMEESHDLLYTANALAFIERKILLYKEVLPAVIKDFRNC